jgi:hypothetical protein
MSMIALLSYLKSSYFRSIYKRCISIYQNCIYLIRLRATLITSLIIVCIICHCTILVAQPFNKVWAWIGLIEQINPPWITISGEYKESVQLQMSNTHTALKEGDWVIYFPHSKHIMPIKSDQFQHLTRELEDWVKVQDIFHHSIPSTYDLP